MDYNECGVLVRQLDATKMKVARNFCANICSILLIASSTFAARIPPSEQHTWLGFGERELGDQLLILDERTTNSTVPISQSIIFQYEDLSFTFANLTVYDVSVTYICYPSGSRFDKSKYFY